MRQVISNPLPVNSGFIIGVMLHPVHLSVTTWGMGFARLKVD
jgi:hypothetical protein